jgi:hypothetical protein
MSQATAGFYDYTYSFPQSGLALALGGFAALRAVGLLGAGQVPTNMLGTARDAAGNPAVTNADGTSTAAWCGEPGGAGGTDPTHFYIAIRAMVSPTQLAEAGVNPGTYGLVATSAAESAAVLGVWE